MIRRPDLHWPAATALVVLVCAVSGCVPANADSPAFSTPTGPATSTGSSSAEAEPASAAQPTPGSATAVTGTAGTKAWPTSHPTTPAPSKAATAATTTVRAGAAITTLATLTVKGRAPKTGYDRARFGQAWADVDRNGCDTRNDILRRDLVRFTVKAGTNGCLVLKGTLKDPYTGRTIAFVRGPGTSTAVQIDHVVALSDAWQKGAQQWATSKRTAFANDPLNLLAVDGPTNAAKGDGDAATWLPPTKAVRCGYVARQVAVKHRYGLWVTAAERDAIIRVLSGCPGQALPTAKAVPLGGGAVAPAVTATPTSTGSVPRPSATAKASRTDPQFRTCREANAAGYGPYRRGVDPEYDWYQDRDHDGLVCER
ncbi:DUF1524 domain-containing protein [Pedococcus sp. KACC 23699]|uniref:DUF1524 domain-containing protein n=1 Tax=Pedococcus sp. KACC 23699 TaxID=3149228 RepID=A0AAU7JPM3_9MICO